MKRIKKKKKLVSLGFCAYSNQTLDQLAFRAGGSSSYPLVPLCLTRKYFSTYYCLSSGQIHSFLLISVTCLCGSLSYTRLVKVHSHLVLQKYLVFHVWHKSFRKCSCKFAVEILLEKQCFVYRMQMITSDRITQKCKIKAIHWCI